MTVTVLSGLTLARGAAWPTEVRRCCRTRRAVASPSRSSSRSRVRSPFRSPAGAGRTPSPPERPPPPEYPPHLELPPRKIPLTLTSSERVLNRSLRVTLGRLVARVASARSYPTSESAGTDGRTDQGMPRPGRSNALRGILAGPGRLASQTCDRADPGPSHWRGRECDRRIGRAWAPRSRAHSGGWPTAPRRAGPPGISRAQKTDISGSRLRKRTSWTARVQRSHVSTEE